MTTELFIKLALSIISLVSVLITAFIIPMVKEHVSAEKLDKLSYYVTVAVRCAEQIYTPEQWKDKKQFVYNYITDMAANYLHVKLTDNDIDIIIEGVVNEIKHNNDIKTIQEG